MHNAVMDDDPDIQPAGEACPKCQAQMSQRDCAYCEDGYSDHDCGDDTCCCAAPEPNVWCDMCRGRGYYVWCRACGWDKLLRRYLK